MLRSLSTSLIFVFMTGFTILAQGADELPNSATLRLWITEMKVSPRGPFARIRWFCKDGSVLPPRPYACAKHGGGAQHGEWSERTKRLQAAGYRIANILADMEFEPIVNAPGRSDRLNQILIEQFLISADNGWILRKARYYRGAFQVEGETDGARRLLLRLSGREDWSGRGFVPLRLATRFLEHGIETGTVAEVRQHSLALSERDKGFMSIRIKLHNKPDAGDAALVREYALNIEDPQLAVEYERLARSIDSVYDSGTALESLEVLITKLPNHAGLKRSVRRGIETLTSPLDPESRFSVTAELMAAIREHLPNLRGASLRLVALDTSLALEVENFAAATALRRRMVDATRRERLRWIQHSINAIYGAGLISTRQTSQLSEGFSRLKHTDISLQTYKNVLDYFSLLPGWGTQWMRFHFFESMQKLAVIEPLSNRFIQDVLRGSALLFYAQVLDSLQRDANRMAGVRHELFGKDVGTGLRSLNPGLASGMLRLSTTDQMEAIDPHGIYLLPETLAELPPIAGILTAGEGNPLSHVQLLARNLGIPNVGIDEALIPHLTPHRNKRVILAVSPAGSIQLMADHGQLDHLFAREDFASKTLIHPDLQKLDLKTRDVIPLNRLRAGDSGRVVGPKAAKLGELRHHYPKAVSNGLAIPFGVFRKLLEQPRGDGRQTVFEWMTANYTSLQRLPPESDHRKQATEAFRSQLEQWILTADPGNDFRNKLRIAMNEVFGADGTYGVFVRSDTNVEDLPGFTGAGLNKTVPNVVGFENVLNAISQVWASPFSRRAFSWRQAHMDQPQHVYPAVLLLRSVPSEKSGVMVTRDIDTGDPGWLSVAVNEGVGGAVDGQAAESLRIKTDDGQVRLLAQATAPWRRVLQPSGGIEKLTASGGKSVLEPKEIKQLIQFAHDLPQRFPAIRDAQGNPAPADIEFGFIAGDLKLFQIRPFLESVRARNNEYLNSLDSGMIENLSKIINLDETPGGHTR